MALSYPMLPESQDGPRQAKRRLGELKRSIIVIDSSADFVYKRLRLSKPLSEIPLAQHID
jgi:hypothetical protein